MKYFSACLILLLMFSSCSNRLTPSCIRAKISEIRSQPKWNPPAQIDEYEYNGRKVYLITADCCDQYIVAVDGKCSYICAPSGGIRGTGDGKCSDFYEKARHIRLVWKDDR
ncbi:MAG TPA: hypothetical protein VF145_00960 [Chitinophagaceae bacterium]